MCNSGRDITTRKKETREDQFFGSSSGMHVRTRNSALRTVEVNSHIGHITGVSFLSYAQFTFRIAQIRASNRAIYVGIISLHFPPESYDRVRNSRKLFVFSIALSKYSRKHKRPAMNFLAQIDWSTRYFCCFFIECNLLKCICVTYGTRKIDLPLFKIK